MDEPRINTLPPKGWPRLRTLVSRAVRRRCPRCGGKGIFANWFSLKERCPTCDAVFVREEGYFLGAYAVNLIVAEFLGLTVVLVILFNLNLSLWEQEIIAVSAAVLLPVLFFPFARTFWMALDLYIDPDTSARRLRGDEIDRKKPS